MQLQTSRFAAKKANLILVKLYYTTTVSGKHISELATSKKNSINPYTNKDQRGEGGCVLGGHKELRTALGSCGIR